MFDNQDRSYLAPTSVLAGQGVLVTGGTGAFGQAFVRLALDSGAKRVVVFSRDEAKQAKMRGRYSDPRLRFFVGDIRNLSRITEACRGVDIMIHAAAMKRVETCEENPSEAIQTNISGTENVARACISAGVKKAILLSTDKAASPNTMYGATKMAAERLWLGMNVYAAGLPTKFSATRYGNVLGSTGSVVPAWKSLVESSKPITMTDPEMTRFWMRMEDAVALVLLALENMRSGEVFVPKIGSSSVGTLAEAVAFGASWWITGSRPSEKKHEILVSKEESRSCYDAGHYLVIEPETRSWGELPPLGFPKVPEGFEYGSDTNPDRLSMETLREMAA